MALPNFLIIGAMKAGTTTLYDDLCRFSSVYMPPEKEPEGLLQADEPAQLRRYERCFSAAKAGQLVGEASTAYAKRPEHEGVAETAARILGRDLKVIYLMRDPVRRIVSQYQHEVGLGLEQRPISTAVREDPRYVAFSRYGYQIEPWLDVFGAEQICLLNFEAYVARRSETLARVAAFLGIDEPIPAELGGARNASSGKAVAKGLWGRVARSQFYLYRIKPYLPISLRDAAKDRLLPKAVEASDQRLDSETEAWIRTQLTPADLRTYEKAR